MNTTQKNLGIGLVLVCALGLVAGWAYNSLQAPGRPSYANFDIKFLFEGSASPTAMVITPDDGNAFLEPVRVPGARDNRIVWKSNKQFQIRFVQVDDQDQPLKPGKELGDEKKDWNDATDVGKGVWEYKLKLKGSSGAGEKETVAAKYLVKLVDPEVIFDPVLIISR